MSSGVSQTDIYNRALTKLGSELISSPTQNVDRARVLDAMYPIVRDSVLRDNPWNFAVKRTILAVSGTTPAWEWGYQFLLPSDFIMLMEVKDQEKYKIEGEYILTDQENNLNIKYIYRNEDTAKYDSLFVEALACKLAFEACERITQSNTKKENLERDYETAMSKAKMRDGYEDDPRDYIEDDWVTARL